MSAQVASALQGMSLNDEDDDMFGDEESEEEEDWRAKLARGPVYHEKVDDDLDDLEEHFDEEEDWDAKLKNKPNVLAPKQEQPSAQQAQAKALKSISVEDFQSHTINSKKSSAPAKPAAASAKPPGGAPAGRKGFISPEDMARLLGQAGMSMPPTGAAINTGAAKAPSQAAPMSLAASSKPADDLDMAWPDDDLQKLDDAAFADDDMKVVQPNPAIHNRTDSVGSLGSPQKKGKKKKIIKVVQGSGPAPPPPSGLPPPPPGPPPPKKKKNKKKRTKSQSNMVITDE